MTKVLHSRGIDSVMAEELAIIPGMDEIVSLDQHLPQRQRWRFRGGDHRRRADRRDGTPAQYARYLPMVRRAHHEPAKRHAQTRSPLIKAFLPSAEILEDVKQLSDRVKSLREALGDPDISSYRPVVNPERMVIKEALRAETYLALFGYPIDAVVCNRVMPPGNYQDAFMQEIYSGQDKLRRQIHPTFAPLPIFEAPYYSHEILGVAELGRLADVIFGDKTRPRSSIAAPSRK